MDGNPPLFILDVMEGKEQGGFENETPSVHRLKSIFLCTLWSWTKLNSIGNLDSLVDFLTWLGYK